MPKKHLQLCADACGPPGACQVGRSRLTVTFCWICVSCRAGPPVCDLHGGVSGGWRGMSGTSGLSWPELGSVPLCPAELCLCGCLYGAHMQHRAASCSPVVCVELEGFTWCVPLLHQCNSRTVEVLQYTHNASPMHARSVALRSGHTCWQSHLQSDCTCCCIRHPPSSLTLFCDCILPCRST